MLCLPLTREVDFCEAKRRRERKLKTTPQSAAADSSPDKGSRQRLTTHLWVAGNRCVAGRPIKSALVRSQYRIGLCPKMKYPPLCGGIIIYGQKHKFYTVFVDLQPCCTSALLFCTNLKIKSR